MTSSTPTATGGPRPELFHEEIRSGKRCYDCGGLYEQQPRLLPDGNPDLSDPIWTDDKQWAAANPSHVSCFQ